MLGLALSARQLNGLGFAGGAYVGSLQLLKGTLLIQQDADLSLSGNLLVNGVVTLAGRVVADDGDRPGRRGAGALVRRRRDDAGGGVAACGRV